MGGNLYNFKTLTKGEKYVEKILWIEMAIDTLHFNPHSNLINGSSQICRFWEMRFLS